MNAVYLQAGETIDYVPLADVAVGEVIVQGDLVGVAMRPIKAGELGSLVVSESLFEFAKTVGAGTAIAVGARVYWDVADKVAKVDDEAGANKYLGKVVKAATDDDATVRVRLSQ